MRVTNGIPLGSPLLLPVGTVNHVQTLKADGRRIVPAGSALAASGDGGILQCHPNFSMVVLANRPGFPFLGSDFFGSMGDVFGCTVLFPLWHPTPPNNPLTKQPDGVRHPSLSGSQPS
jgi:hypothetical protein